MDNGAPLEVIQSLLGHVNNETTGYRRNETYFKYNFGVVV